MTPQEWARKIEALKTAHVTNRILFNATTSTMVNMLDRIWGRGELSDGGTIRYRENYEVYIYKPPFPRAPNGKGKTGNPIKGQWAPTYLAAKASQDRGDFPFELVGDLRLDWGGGPRPEPDEVNPTLCVIRLSDESARKADGLTRQKGEFLKLTAAERELQARNIDAAYAEILRAL